MKNTALTRTKPLQGQDLLRALEDLQGASAVRILRRCGYVLPRGRQGRRTRPRAFIRAVVQARGGDPRPDGLSVARVVRWAMDPELAARRTPASLPRPEVMALAREGISHYREALLELAR